MTVTIKHIFLLLVIYPSSQGQQYFNENDIPELGYLDTSTNPCDDFYQFTCGNFPKLHQRPPDQNVLDHFTLLEDDLVKLGQEILGEPLHLQDPLSVKKAKMAFKACMDDKEPPYPPELMTLKEVGGMPLLSPAPSHEPPFTWNEIGELVGAYGIPLIFSFNIIQLNPGESAILLSPDPLNNPSLFRPVIRNNYEIILEEAFKEKALAPFDIFLQTIVHHLLQYTFPEKPQSDIEADLNAMVSFMRQLYAGGIPIENHENLKNEINLRELQEWSDLHFSGAIDWVQYLSKIFHTTVITPETRFVQRNLSKLINGVLNLVKLTDPKIVKNFVLLRIFLFQAPDSDLKVRGAFEEYYSTKGYKLYPRWEYCTRKILDVVDTASLSYAVAYQYQRYHYNVNQLSEADDLIKRVQEAFKELLSTNQWMDETSNRFALEKLQNTLVLLGFPWISLNEESLDTFYQNLKICPFNNYGNAKRLRAFKQAYQFTQLGEPQRDFWGKSPFDPNAYYNRPNNKIVIPVSMVNPVFFYGGNPILDLSRLGSIIGHELTHGFDVYGKNYNQEGAQEPWWSAKTLEEFNERSKCFVEQYSKFYVPEIDTYINGSYCLNENLADNGGIKQSYSAFQKLLLETNIQANGNYTLEQLFFIGYGTMWCGDESPSALKTLVSTIEGYPPKKFRVLGSLQNFEEFSKAFNCPKDSQMNPQIKCTLW